MGDPYREGAFTFHPFAARKKVTGKVVAVLRGKLENRGLNLITPISRAIRQGEIHELILTAEEGAAPGRVVQKIAYLGFVEFTCGGVTVVGDEVRCGGRKLGEIAGFDETHLPNHLNMVIFSPHRLDGQEMGLTVGAEIEISPEAQEGDSMYEKRLAELGIKLPAAPKPVASYVPAVKAGSFVFSSGQIPLSEGQLLYRGKVGSELSEEEGYRAARLCALNCLGAIKEAAGSLDLVEQVVKVTGYVNSAPGFNRQPSVVNGASDLLLEIFGEAGRHARAAVGVSELPLDAAVEIEVVVKLRG